MKTLDQYGFGGILADDMGLGKTHSGHRSFGGCLQQRGDGFQAL
ncbi:MAG: hypothetical protein ACLVAV_08195 [Clostridium sp.]